MHRSFGLYLRFGEVRVVEMAPPQSIAPAPRGEETTKSVFLMSPEESGLLMMPSSLVTILTVTFFKGKVPTEDLKRRITEIVQANPWLACRLKKQMNGEIGKKKPAMVYDTQPSADAIVADHYKEYCAADIQDKKELADIDVGQPYEAICKAVSKSDAKLSCGGACVGKNHPQFRVTAVPSADGERFALLVSLSHVIADGYTYYEILNLLSLNAPMKALNPIRTPGFSEALKEAVGKDTYDFPGSAGYIFNALGNMLFGSKPKIRAHFIDKDKVAAAKAKEAGGSVPFVSTNDVVTSTFGKLTRTNVLEMAIDMRERLPAFTKVDAGNYEFALYSRPAGLCNAVAGPAGSHRQGRQVWPPLHGLEHEAARPLGSVAEAHRHNHQLVKQSHWRDPPRRRLQARAALAPLLRAATRGRHRLQAHAEHSGPHHVCEAHQEGRLPWGC